ncbi:uncharacterized protein LOC134258146 isoform X4 [Saccostrea cucullata]|uniref:uncharacterized protein LOC134258146 isoform X4 n=2 Tax=Saccostrea cuccullata TaxID=36930 RepID=UPI002ED5273D
MKKRKRMSCFSANIFISLLILFAQNESVSSKSCLASMPTLQLVEECPKTKEEWNKRSDKKRCDMLAGTSQCSSFAYHCLLNQNGNETVEVCAPTWFLSGFCAIYNTDEFRVIDNFSFDCNNNTKIKKGDRCPSRYISTETYKYQICYRKREVKDLESDRIHQSNMEEGSSPFVLTTVFIVLFILALIASIFLCVLLHRVGCDKIWKNEQTYRNNTNVSTQENPFLGNNQGITHQIQSQEDGIGDENHPLLEENKTAAKNQSKEPMGNVEVSPETALNEKRTKTNKKAKNDHEEAKKEREKERRGLADKQRVQQGREIFEKNEAARNAEVFPGQSKETTLNGRRIEGEKAADSNILGCVGQTVENNSRGFAHGAEEKRQNVSSSEDFNKPDEEEEEAEKEAEKEEKKLAITNSTSGNNQPHPSPHREGFATDIEERRDNVPKKEDFNKPEEDLTEVNSQK